MTGDRVREADFNLHIWFATIPMTDDIYLGLQAQNIARVEMSVMRRWEKEVLDEQAADPGNYQGPKYRELTALSQMWVFALYEYLRTWRQRARILIQFEDNYLKLTTQRERDGYLKEIIDRAKKKAHFATRFPVYYPDHVAKISDPEFMKSVRAYFAEMAQLYETLSAVRMPAAKHELPKKRGEEAMIADGPGMGLPSPHSGSIGWQVVLGDKETTIVRRDLADEFFGLLSWHEDVETALVLAKEGKDRRNRLRRQVARQSHRLVSSSGPLDQYFRTEQEAKQDQEPLTLKRSENGRQAHAKQLASKKEALRHESRTPEKVLEARTPKKVLPVFEAGPEPLPYFVREPGPDTPHVAPTVKRLRYHRQRRR
jgi:hypothetical protein